MTSFFERKIYFDLKLYAWTRLVVCPLWFMVWIYNSLKLLQYLFKLLWIWLGSRYLATFVGKASQAKCYVYLWHNQMMLCQDVDLIQSNNTNRVNHFWFHWLCNKCIIVSLQTYRLSLSFAYSLFNSIINIKVNMLKIIVKGGRVV